MLLTPSTFEDEFKIHHDDPKVEFEPPSLIPCPITLSIVHLEIAAEELVKYPVTVLAIPATGMTPVVHFNAILQETATSCLMLESFCNEFVANKATEGPYYQKFSLASRGISHFVFQSALGELQEDSHWRNRSAPDFKVVGTTCVPFTLDGHLFTPHFFSSLITSFLLMAWSLQSSPS